MEGTLITVALWLATFVAIAPVVLILRFAYQKFTREK